MEILGIKVDSLKTEEALKKIEGFLSSGRQHYIVTPNPEFLVRAQKDEQFKKILNQADLAVPDGIGLFFASLFLGQPLKERITGTDLMEKICQKAAQNKWPVFLFGAGPGIAQKAAQVLKKKYSGLEIEELLFSEEDGQSGKIDQSQPAVLFVALGAAKQEKWISDYLKEMPSIKLAMGVGGAFDFISGQTKRAPRLLRSIGLEWLWRMILEPWRASRIYQAVIKFSWLVLKSRLQR